MKCWRCGTDISENQTLKQGEWNKWINSCPDNVPSIEEIRKITAKIPYSMADESQK